ncbi:macro domain-containing protein [Campylobacter sp. 46490-21]|uniref:macro domain-containing protein n=1 Tax=Campylobacter magnus TaxID=3026462 RepID=UPI00236095CE|nr:macro domain-containing protein [Campylobacter magnus]MDD0847698.1 macro domain-containing protein [Campylobacter magnus]
MLEIKRGNIFTSKAQTIVNTVNCEGVMGAGIAFELRLRHPKMFKKYKEFCKQNAIKIGTLWIYNLSKDENANYAKILAFPTKTSWKLPSKEEYLHAGLSKFIKTYEEKGIESIAFPLLGASRGGIDENVSLKIMKEYLSGIEIPVEIWHFDPSASDDLYDKFKEKFLSCDENYIKEHTELKTAQINTLLSALQNQNIHSMSGMLSVKGVGDLTIQRAFDFIQKHERGDISYDRLF